MRHGRRGLVRLLTLTLLLTLLPAAPAQGAQAGGYHAVAAWDMDFIAAGDGGRLTLLSVDGTRRELSTPCAAALWDVTVWENTTSTPDAASTPDTAWIVGDGGTVLAFDGTDCREWPVTDGCDLRAAAVFDNTLFLGGAGGALYRGDGSGNWNRESLALRGDIVALAAGSRRLVGVTSAGESFTYAAADGFTVHTDPTGEKAAFVDIAANADGTAFWASARRADGTSAVYHTVYGGVFSERTLTRMDGAAYDPAGLQVNGLAAAGEQMTAACGGGQLLTLPDCVDCNKLQTLPAAQGAELTAVCRNGGILAAVGDGFAAALTDDETVRQYKVSADTALTWQQEGAVLVDVRETADWAAGHLAGSLSVPLGELEALLPRLVPDRETTVIFYCTKGVRSQTAVERAWALEYYHVYSLGGLDSWPYGLTTGERPGDVNGDGDVDTADARLTLQYAARRIRAAALDSAAADVNGDGSVDTTDARLILQYAAKRIPDFPADA